MSDYLERVARISGPIAAGMFAGMSFSYNIGVWPSLDKFTRSTLPSSTRLRIQDKIIKQNASFMPGIIALSAASFLYSARFLSPIARTPRLVAGVLMAFNLPWTIIMLLPVNKTISARATALEKSPDADAGDKADAETQEKLITKWLKLHAVRVGVSIVAFVIGVADLADLV